MYITGGVTFIVAIYCYTKVFSSTDGQKMNEGNFSNN